MPKMKKPVAWTLLEPAISESSGHEDLVGIWKNHKYQVLVMHTETEQGWPQMLWLSIRRNDRAPIADWRDLQRIKDELVGTDAEAVQIFPAQSRLVDTSNQFHLFCMPPGVRLPLGWHSRNVSNGPTQADFELAKEHNLDIRSSKQRKVVRPEHQPPDDLMMIGPIWAAANIELKPILHTNTIPKEELELNA